ncbi:MAG: HDOD domain-containing protein [Dactylosporangium sp.]|nr:HDOD domain-containing protein [Dactylosporangium sp.]
MGRIFGYELLFRESGSSTTSAKSTAYATSQVIVNAFTEFGVYDLVGNRVCFVNLTRDFLVGALPIPVEPAHAVLEVLETVPIDDAVINGVRVLVEKGHKIALDDFVWGRGHERLLPVASYVKLDILGTPRDDIERMARDCLAYPNIQLLGERLETPADLSFARKLGCSLFQGYVLARPQVVSARVVPSSRLRHVELMGMLSRSDVEMPEIVSIVTSDPALSFRLLRASNSASSGLPRRVSSVHEALVLLGLAKVREWVSLMLLSDLTEGDESTLASAITRARLCQLVADRIGSSGEAAFTAGLLSAVGDILGVPIGDLVDRLPLADDVAAALVGRIGGIGRALDIVEAYESGDLENLRESPIATQELTHAFLKATGFSTHSVSRISDGDNPARNGGTR